MVQSHPSPIISLLPGLHPESEGGPLGASAAPPPAPLLPPPLRLLVVPVLQQVLQQVAPAEHPGGQVVAEQVARRGRGQNLCVQNEKHDGQLDKPLIRIKGGQVLFIIRIGGSKRPHIP